MGLDLSARGRVRPNIEAAVLVLPILVGLGASAALLVDYVRSAPVFCAEGGGCDAVKQTSFAALWGVPTPLFGLAGFALLSVSGVLRGSWVRVFHVVAALLGAAVGARLIAAQAALGEYCVYCMAVDLAACAAAAAAAWRVTAGWELPGGRALRAAALSLFAAFPGAVLGVGFLVKGHLPPLIAEEIQKAPKGKATVVEFVDFECPFCRDEWSDLAPLLLASKGKVRVVRKLVPLTGMHPHALDAARAACCAEMLGKGDAMAEALFGAPVEELTVSGCEKIAKDLGLDTDRYEACLSDPKTTERIAMDRQDFDRAKSKGDGLPLLWIGEKKIMGRQGADALRLALDEAIAKTGS